MTFTVICVGIVIFIAIVLLTGAVSRFLAWVIEEEWDFAVCLTKLLYLTGRI